MSFLTPAALALAALALPIVALYFLKLRREEYRVSSTYLWRTLVRDSAANAPWQRLRPNLLLFLQLLLLACLVLALARPFTWNSSAAGDHLILIVDTSASMAATDETPDRLAAAVRAAQRLVAGLPATARVTVIAAAGRAAAGDETAAGQTRVLISGSTDRHEAQAALAGLRAGAGGSNLSDAVNLAAAIAVREADPETAILSDGNVTLPERAQLPGRVRFVPVGRPDTGNQGIIAFSLQPGAGGQTLAAFLQVINASAQPAQRRLVLTAGGQVVAAAVLSLAPGASQPLAFADLPAGAAAIEARLEGSDPLAVDDVAWAVPPQRGATRIDVVGSGNRFLETALGLLPSVKVTAVKPADYRPTDCGAAVDCTPAGLTIFDGVAAPAPLPPGSLLFLAPAASGELFAVAGQIAAPQALPAAGDEPLLRYVDVRDLAIRSAAQVPLPAWARPVLVAGNTSTTCPAASQAQTQTAGPAASACPLLFAGETGGHRVAVLAFDLRQSDLALRVAFPILLANLVDYLDAGQAGGTATTALLPGQALTLVAPAGATALMVTPPGGGSERLPLAAGRAAFGATATPGVYTVESLGADGQATFVSRFAVNVFDPQEADLAVRNTLTLAGSGDGAGRTSGSAAPRERREWWRAVAWLALAALVAEWLYAHRSQVWQLRDALVLR